MIFLKVLWWCLAFPLLSPIFFLLQYRIWKNKEDVYPNLSRLGNKFPPRKENFFTWFIDRNNIFKED